MINPIRQPLKKLHNKFIALKTCFHQIPVYELFINTLYRKFFLYYIRFWHLYVIKM